MIAHASTQSLEHNAGRTHLQIPKVADNARNRKSIRRAREDDND
jgi:hypothetical protein